MTKVLEFKYGQWTVKGYIFCRDTVDCIRLEFTGKWHGTLGTAYRKQDGTVVVPTDDYIPDGLRATVISKCEKILS